MAFHDVGDGNLLAKGEGVVAELEQSVLHIALQGHAVHRVLEVDHLGYPVVR